MKTLSRINRKYALIIGIIVCVLILAWILSSSTGTTQVIRQQPAAGTVVTPRGLEASILARDELSAWLNGQPSRFSAAAPTPPIRNARVDVLTVTQQTPKQSSVWPKGTTAYDTTLRVSRTDQSTGELTLDSYWLVTVVDAQKKLVISDNITPVGRTPYAKDSATITGVDDQALISPSAKPAETVVTAWVEGNTDSIPTELLAGTLPPSPSLPTNPYTVANATETLFQPDATDPNQGVGIVAITATQPVARDSKDLRTVAFSVVVDLRVINSTWRVTGLHYANGGQ